MQDARSVPATIAAVQVGLCAIWGLGQIATKVGIAGISPLWQAGLRSLGACILVLAWMVARGLPVARRDGTLWPGLAIGVLFALEFVCLYIGLVYTGAARATLLIYTAPFVVAIGTHFFVPGDRLSRNKLLGLLLAFAGVVLAFRDRVAGGSAAADADALLGDILCLAAAFFWGATTVVVKATRLRATQPEKTLLYQLAVSAVLLLGASLAVGEAGVFAPTPLIWAALAYQTLIVAGISYLTWFWLVSRYRATTLHAFTFLTPVFGVLFAWLLLGERVDATQVGALVAIAAGIVLVNRS